MSKQDKRYYFIYLFLIFQIFIQSCGLVGPDKNLGRIYGEIKDSNGFMLPDTRVGILGMARETKSDREGKFLLSEIPTGNVTVVATRGEVSITQIVKVEKDATTEDVVFIFTEADQLAPTLSNIQATGITETSATITWNTNEPATSRVEYGLSALYGSSTTELTDLTTSHTVILTSLKANSQYHYRVKSKDAAGNEVTSADFIFSTTSGQAPNVPTGLIIADPENPGSLNLSWAGNTEDDLAGYELHRSTEPDRDFTQVNSGGTSTTYTDSGLNVGEKYYYKLRSYDTGGNKSTFTNTASKVVTGPLNANVTWKASKNPYILSGDILVDIGKVLSILPGTVVKAKTTSIYNNALGNKDKVEIIIRGAMNARGTASSTIQFTSDAAIPRREDWWGLRFLGATDSLNAMDNCVINFGNTAIFSDASTLSFTNNKIGYCTFGVDTGRSPMIAITGNEIINCDFGIHSFNSVVKNNLIQASKFGLVTYGTDNIEYNTIDAGIGIQVQSGKPIIKNNILAYGAFGYLASGGIGIAPSPTLISTGTAEYNNIFNYQLPLGPGYNNPIGSGTLFVNPLFRGTGQEPYKLQRKSDGYASDSPLLTAGSAGTQMGRYGP
ncbi:fibronectin type III domain-containing protein [Candidatus Riflebacteria bacterium]